MTRLMPLLFGLAACAPDHTDEGVAVGNPGQGMTVQLEPGSGVATVDGALPLNRLRTVSCLGVDLTLDGSEVISPTGASLLTLPGEFLCEVELGFKGPITLSGEGDDGARFALTLDVPALRVRSHAPFHSENPLLLVLGPGPWLSAMLLGLGLAGEVEITPADPRHDDLAALIADQSILCEDRDGDRWRDPGDRVLAAGDDVESVGWQVGPPRP